MIDFVEISQFLCYSDTYIVEFDPHARFNAIIGKSGGGKSVFLSALSYVLGEIDVLDLDAQAFVLVKFTGDETLFKRGFPDLYSIAGSEVEREEYLCYIQEKATVLHFNLGQQFLEKYRDPLSIRSFIDNYLVKSGFSFTDEYPFFNKSPEDERIAFEFETSRFQSLDTALAELKREHASIARSITLLQRKHTLVEATSTSRRVRADIPLLVKQIFNLTLDEHAKLLDKLTEQTEISDQAWGALDQYKQEIADRKFSLNKRLKDIEVILKDATAKEIKVIKDGRVNMLRIDLEKLGILEEYFESPIDITSCVENDTKFDVEYYKEQSQETFRVNVGNLASKQAVFRAIKEQMETSLSSLTQQISTYHSTIVDKRELLAKMHENLAHLKSRVDVYKNIQLLTVGMHHSCHAEDIVDEFRKIDPYCEGLITDLIVFDLEYEPVIYTVLREYDETPIVFSNHKMIQYCSTMFKNSEYCTSNLTILCSSLMPYLYDSEIPLDLIEKFPGICWVSSMVSSRTNPLTVVVKNSVKQYYYLANKQKARELAKLTGIPVIDKHCEIHRQSRSYIIVNSKSITRPSKSQMNETEDLIRAENVRTSMLEEEIISMELDMEFMWRCSKKVVNVIANLSERYSHSILEYSKVNIFPRGSFLGVSHKGVSFSPALSRFSLPILEDILNSPIVTIEFAASEKNQEREIIESISVHGLEAHLERDAIDRAIQESYRYALELEERVGILVERVDASTANIVCQWQNMSIEDRAECTQHEGNHEIFDHFRPFSEVITECPLNLYYLKTKLRYEQERNALAGKITVEKDRVHLESSQRQIEESIKERKQVGVQIRTTTKQLSVASSRLESIKEAKIVRCEKILERLVPLFKLAYRELNPHENIGSVSTVDAGIYECNDHIGVTFKVSSDKKILLSITELSQGEFILFGAALQISLAMLCNNTVLLLDEFESSLDRGAAKNLFELLKGMVHSPNNSNWLLSVTQKTNTYSLADQLIGVRKKHDATSLSIKSFV